MSFHTICTEISFRCKFSALVITLGMLAGCDQETREVSEPVTEPAATATPTPVTMATATPSPTPVAARKGLFLNKRVTITNDTGIYGFDPGTELKMLSRKGETLVVIANGMQIEVAQADTTDEMPSTQATAPQQSMSPKPASRTTAGALKTPVPGGTAMSPQEVSAARAAAREKRLRQIAALKQQIEALENKREEIWRQTWVPGRDPNKTPEGKARIAEMHRIEAQVRQINLQIGQLRSAPLLP